MFSALAMHTSMERSPMIAGKRSASNAFPRSAENVSDEEDFHFANSVNLLSLITVTLI